ncbi:MAG TPA: hypothetical protein VK190_02500 [Pseudoneobacillus sp.]|nr:hypothetical protein [Pseudoneobacillus sp.]
MELSDYLKFLFVLRHVIYDMPISVQEFTKKIRQSFFETLPTTNIYYMNKPCKIEFDGNGFTIIAPVSRDRMSDVRKKSSVGSNLYKFHSNIETGYIKIGFRKHEYIISVILDNVSEIYPITYAVRELYDNYCLDNLYIDRYIEQLPYEITYNMYEYLQNVIMEAKLKEGVKNGT